MPRTAVNYGRLPTEQVHPRTRHLDQLTPRALARLMSREDARAVRAVDAQQASIGRAIALITARLRAGGRLSFVGAGTSGRLGVLEAAECPPTFHTLPSLVQAFMAGGRASVFRSREGAEDNARAGAALGRRLRSRDVVVGIAASGVTPFVQAALARAKRNGAATVLVTCHPKSPIRADCRIALSVGPEVLAGSTRLKAGTATKLVLNMLTLGTMVGLGKTYGNLMVDLRPTSRKLEARAQRLVQTLTGLPPARATQLLRAARGRVKPAVLMHQRGVSYRAACVALTRAGGSLRRALAQRA